MTRRRGGAEGGALRAGAKEASSRADCDIAARSDAEGAGGIQAGEGRRKLCSENLAREAKRGCGGRMLIIAVGVALALVAVDVLDLAKLRGS